MPTVSVVIPTKNRPETVQYAIRSVLNQTYDAQEIIVVIDGPDLPTEMAMKSLSDPRLKVVVNPQNVGLAESRNVGVRCAQGKWVAFLDDDDEWLPAKLAKQIRVAEDIGTSHVFVVSRFVERTDTMERIWPEMLPVDTDRFSEYLFCNRGMLLPSSYLVSRQLMNDVPFTAGLRHIEDLDWLLRATSDPRTRIGSVPEPMLIYNNYSKPDRESRNFPWQIFYSWSVQHRALFTPQSFAFFITKGVVPRAREAGASWRQLGHLLSAALFLGSFDLRTVFFFVASSCFTREFKRKAREALLFRFVASSRRRGS
jgi:glycosyltransferase involved in cell wall biosynthesis